MVRGISYVRLSSSLPCAFLCLPNKQPICYKLALEAIKNKGVDAPSTVHLDFEQAEIKAVKEVYPESHIVTCHVHWRRALREKLGKIGLLPYSNRDATIQVTEIKEDVIKKLFVTGLSEEVLDTLFPPEGGCCRGVRTVYC